MIIGNRQHSIPEMEETAEQEAVSLGGDARGKHRILAELGRVEQEVTFLEVTANIDSFSSNYPWEYVCVFEI